jgi:eukaryotic-like serine/threonine-protein kinase
MSAPTGGLTAGGRIAGRYELERRIAVGGMGEVWEAVDERLGRTVAVKVLRAELSDDDEFLHRFRIEARTVASLNHSGIAAIHDYGEDEVTADGRRTAYLVMELVRGEPLSAVIARGPMEPAETLRIMEQASHSLYAAHERGFVHRDVKPGNILIRVDGTVKLTDFGIAKAANAVPVTRTGMVMGTAHYIAPEQASGGEAGPEGDVYSLGIVGYECLAGHRPFRAENAVAVAMMQVRDAPPPLPPTVPWRVRQLIETILVKDPDKRYADGAELAAAVAAIRRDEDLPTPARMVAQGLRLPETAVPDEPETPTRKRKRRGRSDSRGRTATPPPSAPVTPERPTRGPAAAPGPTTSGQVPSARSGPAPVEKPSKDVPVSPVAEQPRTETPHRSTDSSAVEETVRTKAAERPPRPRPTPAPPPPRPIYHPGPPAPPTEPLRLVAKPARSAGGTALLVAFVLLIVAAIVVAVLTVPALFGGQSSTETPVPSPTPTPAALSSESVTHPGDARGSVTRRGVVLARSADSVGPDGRMIAFDSTSHDMEETR